MLSSNRRGIVTAYGNKDLGKQTFTWTNVDWSSRMFCGIHMVAIS